MKKRVGALLLALAMVLTMMPVGALAADLTEGPQTGAVTDPPRSHL